MEEGSRFCLSIRFSILNNAETILAEAVNVLSNAAEFRVWGFNSA